MTKVDFEPQPVVSACNNAIRGLPASMALANQQMGARATATARMRHRYHRRSGLLSSSTKFIADEHEATVYIEDAAAPYGKYVHDGFRSWAPDQFIPEAIEASEEENLADIEKNLAADMRRAGFSVTVS